MNVLVTGASGFVGRALCQCLETSGHRIVRAERHVQSPRNDGEGGGVTETRVGCGAVVVSTRHPRAQGEGFVAAANGGQSGAPVFLAGGEGYSAVDVVVHLAARVHVVCDHARNLLPEFRAANVAGTLNLARQAAQASVKRFVFVSSIKVNGEGRDEPYRETDAPAPEDAYAISKWEAEQGLWRIAEETGMEVVILRPPLVYGPGVKANFRRLLETVARGWPLPLGAIENRRSLLYLGNFVDAIRVCLEHPAAAGQTFLIDDGEPVSTPDLIRVVARAMGRPARLVAVPPRVLDFLGMLLGKRAAVARLTGSLWVDSSLIRTRLGWTPPYSLEAGLAETVAR